MSKTFAHTVGLQRASRSSVVTSYPNSRATRATLPVPVNISKSLINELVLPETFILRKRRALDAPLALPFSGLRREECLHFIHLLYQRVDVLHRSVEPELKRVSVARNSGPGLGLGLE